MNMLGALIAGVKMPGVSSVPVPGQTVARKLPHFKIQKSVKRVRIQLQ
jgi:hypothetical protein